MKKENKKSNFFKEIKYSIFDFEKYQNLAINKIKRTILYATFLSLIVSAVLVTIYLNETFQIASNLIEYIQNSEIDFEYINNNLSFKNNDKIEIENKGRKLIIDTENTEKEENYVSKLTDASVFGIVLLKNSMIIKSDILGITFRYNYVDLATAYEIGDFDKSKVIEYINQNDIKDIYSIITESIVIPMAGMKNSFAINILALYVSIFIQYFTLIIMQSIYLLIIGYCVSRIAKIPLKLRPIYNIFIYSLTLPMMLNMIYYTIRYNTGFYIRYFDIMTELISYVYIIVAILLIKTDFIEKSQELVKVIEVHKQTSKDNIKENNEEDEERKEDKEENTKKDNQDESPESSV